MNAAVRKWIPALAPGLVLVLLAVQVQLGLRGFHLPHAGLLGAMELPGRLVGWGGAALLLPLFVWLLLGWWGYGVTGMALKTLGAVTLGLAVGTLAALWGSGDATGGRIGGALAHLLSESLGPLVAAVLLLLMAAPGVLLASARFHLGALPAGAPASRAGSSPAPVLGRPRPVREAAPPPASGPSAATPAATAGGARPSRPQGWYPQRRYDAQGNELPMDFGKAKDVGTVRFRDPEEPPPAKQVAAAAAPQPAQPGTVDDDLAAEPDEEGGAEPGADLADEGAAAQVPDAAEPDAKTGWPRGLVAAQEQEDAPAQAARPPAMRSAADRLRPGSARPPARPPAPAEPKDEPPKKVFARHLFPKNAGDNVLLPGVRYRDEPQAEAAPPAAAVAPPAAPAAPPAPTPPARAPASPAPTPPAPQAAAPARTTPEAPPAALPPAAGRPARATPAAPREPAAREPAQRAPETRAPETRAPETRAPETRALEPMGDQAANASYRSKLEASGFFAAAAPAGASTVPEGAAPPAPRAARAAPTPIEPAAPAPEPARPEPPPARRTAPPPAPPKPAPPAQERPAATWIAELKDAEFARAVDAALERGAASAVLLTRRLGLGYGKAQALVKRLSDAGVLGEVAPNGSRPVLITKDEVDAARSAP